MTKKYSQRKTLHNLKTDEFQLPDNKNIAILFSKYELFSWIKLTSILVHLK